MINILLCNDDVLQHILKLYIEYYLNCKKDITNNNLSCCKKIYYIYKNLIVKYCKCNILYIENINYKICSYHDNISLDFVKCLLEQIENNLVEKSKANIEFHTIHSYKGLENDTVRISNDINIQQEQNLYYVALKRGMKNLIID